MAYIRSEPFLFENLALKGGTAINLTIFDLPRLSVDIDLDYTNNSSKEDMLKDRIKIKSLLIDYLRKTGYQLVAAHPDKFEKSNTPKADAVFFGARHNHVGIKIAWDGTNITVQEGNIDYKTNTF